MILSKKTKHGLLSMGLAFGILTSSVVSPASVSVLASDYSARNVLSDAYIQSQFPAPISEENITSASVRSEALQKCQVHGCIEKSENDSERSDDHPSF